MGYLLAHMVVVVCQIAVLLFVAYFVVGILFTRRSPEGSPSERDNIKNKCP